MSMSVTSEVSQRPRPLTGLRVGLITALVLSLLFGAMIAITFSMQNEVIAHDRDNQMGAISQAITAALDQAGRFALTQAETTARQAAVARALAAGDRAALSELAGGTYAYLKTQGVPVFGFHAADMTYLLRLHLPDKFGDDLTKIRPMVLAANKTGRSQVGLEIGIAGTFVRGIAVVRDGDRFVGTVETGLNLEPILEQVKALTNADIAVVLSQSLADLPPRGASQNGAGETFGDLMALASTDTQLFNGLLRDGAIRLTRTRDVSAHQLQGGSAAVLVQPLIDFSGRMIGNIAAVKTFPAHGAALQRTRTELIAAAMIGAILAFVAFSVLARMIAMRGQS
ncbi:conserved hypothetical protein [Rhodopseudomonas palustris BisB5]|uniref:Double Cache domain-containing protein n=1 Tax=Rhodopseudomonas palustris (strain BisB5) TaxID=316057 RepID=Q136G3_RHOPS|nr:conserved hypothetical protein [Rhodopseudomonas palustris BisB5]